MSYKDHMYILKTYVNNFYFLLYIYFQSFFKNIIIFFKKNTYLNIKKIPKSTKK